MNFIELYITWTICLSHILVLRYIDVGNGNCYIFLNNCFTFIISHCDRFNMRHSEHNLNVDFSQIGKLKSSVPWAVSNTSTDDQYR